mmetsp:Transcript_21221/g.23776  ORF Transcript_21221/g.23776 Transcript_21221/m.23776 type:complete len:337 (+) Transcript_21221:75-1085(+)
MKKITNMFVLLLMILWVDIVLAQESLHGTGNTSIIDGSIIDDTNNGIKLSNHESAVDSIIHRRELLLPLAPKIDLPPLLESKLSSDHKNDDSSNVANDEGQKRNLSFYNSNSMGSESSSHTRSSHSYNKPPKHNVEPFCYEVCYETTTIGGYGGKGGKGGKGGYYGGFVSSSSSSDYFSAGYDTGYIATDHKYNPVPVYQPQYQPPQNDHKYNPLPVYKPPQCDPSEWCYDYNCCYPPQNCYEICEWVSGGGGYYGGKGGKGGKGGYYGGGFGGYYDSGFYSDDAGFGDDTYRRELQVGYGGKGGKGGKGGGGSFGYEVCNTVCEPVHTTPLPYYR